MASLSVNSFSYALKTIYNSRKVFQLFYKDNPLLARINKKTGFGGENKVFSVVHAPGTGESASFGTAQENAGGASGKKFTVTRANSYSVRHIDNETIEASEGNEGALLQALKTEADAAIQQLKNVLGWTVFGDGSGQLGTVKNPGANTTLSLTNPDDVTKFYLGQKLVFAANTASALRDSGAFLRVTGRDEVAGTLTVHANVNSIGGITNGDTIFTQGRYVSANDRLNMRGVDGWIPRIAPAPGDSWWGVDRSEDQTRLAGFRFTDASTYVGYNEEQAIKLLARFVGRAGFTPDIAVMSFTRLDALIATLGSKVTYSKVTVPIHNVAGKIIAEVGFDAVRIHTPAGTIDCIADRSCPANTLYVLTSDVWEMWTLGEMVRWISSTDGGMTRTRESADGVELRLVSRGNIVCLAPVANARFDWV